MSYIILLYFLVIVILLILGYLFYKKDKGSSGFFYFLFSISTSVWFLFYFLSYFSSNDINILLSYSRITYSISIVAIYSFLLFIIYYGTLKKKIFSKINIIIFVFFTLILSIYNFTPLIIEGMTYNSLKDHYYEKEGILINLHNILSFGFLILLILFSYLKLKSITLIKKMRLRFILYGLLTFISLTFLFLLILPAFGIRILEKEIVLFIIPFLIAVWYSLNRYYFMNLKISLGKIIIFSLVVLFTILFISLFKFLFFSFGNHFITFWGLNNRFGFFDLIMGILIYLSFYKYISKFFSSNITNNISKIKNKIPFIIDILELNIFLEKQFKKIFKIKYTKIILIGSGKNNELVNYFNKNILNNLFINDIVFIEENKYKFNYKKLKKETNKHIYIYFPLFNNRKLIGLLAIGGKIFKDHFYDEEIKQLKSFATFLEGHLKYIKIYEEINNLSINLDKKVDKKTMKYNNLLNKQKEFISILSHEIKGPVGSCIFQVDCLIDDINEGGYTEKYLKEELNLLNDQLLKSGELINKLFSVQKIDTKKMILFKEKINLPSLILEEIKNYKKNNRKINFINNIDKSIGFINIDKVHFKQVIDNLINNAIKFSKNQKKPKIIISLYLKGNNIIIKIEDNGNGFKNTDIKNIFEKYNTGGSNSIGIGMGMGLYLCKNIVELHKGKIKANISNKLGGAEFIIKIPKE